MSIINNHLLQMNLRQILKPSKKEVEKGPELNKNDDTQSSSTPAPSQTSNPPQTKQVINIPWMILEGNFIQHKTTTSDNAKETENKNNTNSTGNSTEIEIIEETDYDNSTKDNETTKISVREMFDCQAKYSDSYDELYSSLPRMLSSDRPDVQQFAKLMYSIFEKFDAKSDAEKTFLLKISIDTISEMSEKADSDLIEISDILNNPELQQKYEKSFNGIIDDFKQSQSGPCGMFAAVKALCSSSLGQKYLSDTIKWSDDHSEITIMFTGLEGRTVTISMSDILNCGDAYVLGDIEVVAIAMAVEQIRREFADGAAGIESGDEELNRILNAYSGDGYTSPAHKREGNEKFPGGGLHGIPTEQVLFFLTGLEAHHIDFDDDKTKENYRRNLLDDNFKTHTSVVGLSNNDLYNFYKRHNVYNLSEEELQSLKTSGHVLAVIAATEDSVTLALPEADSSMTITISWEEFFASIDFATEIDLAPGDGNDYYGPVKRHK